MYLDIFRCVYFPVVTGCFGGLLRRQYDGEVQIRRHPGEGGSKGSLIYPARRKFWVHRISIGSKLIIGRISVSAVLSSGLILFRHNSCASSVI